MDYCLPLFSPEKTGYFWVKFILFKKYVDCLASAPLFISYYPHDLFLFTFSLLLHRWHHSNVIYFASQVSK